VFVRIGQRAGITRFPTRPHLLRRTLETIRRQAGIDARVRSRMLAHGDPASLNAYTDVQDRELVEARRRQAEEMRRYIGGEIMPRDDAPALIRPDVSARDREEGPED
jgi:hypothetical protein